MKCKKQINEVKQVKNILERKYMCLTMFIS